MFGQYLYTHYIHTRPYLSPIFQTKNQRHQKISIILMKLILIAAFNKI